MSSCPECGALVWWDRHARGYFEDIPIALYYRSRVGYPSDLPSPTSRPHSCKEREMDIDVRNARCRCAICARFGDAIPSSRDGRCRECGAGGPSSNDLVLWSSERELFLCARCQHGGAKTRSDSSQEKKRTPNVGFDATYRETFNDD